MLHSRRLILAHFWLAFAAFGVALVLGAWQMFVRSPLYAWISDSATGITARSRRTARSMAYVFPTLVAMGFGYAISESRAGAAADRPALGLGRAWALVVVGAVMALVPVALGRASVLYTFYPPLIGSAFYYIGVVLVVVGSLDLGRADVGQSARLEARPSRRAGAAGDVRQRRRRLSLGLDVGRRGARTAVPDHPGRARLASRPSTPASRACCSPGRCTRSSISG